LFIGIKGLLKGYFTLRKIFEMKSWQESKFYNISAGAYKENQDKFIALLETNSEAKILDIGCNSGEFTARISERVNTKQVYGIEIIADEAMAAINKGIKVEISDANKPFPFEDDFFDIVTANQSVEHLYDSSNFFKEVYRVLKKNGSFIISTLNLCSWHNIVCMILGMQPPGMHLCEVQMGNFLSGTETHGHIKLFSLNAVKDILKYYNFKVEKTNGAGYYPFPTPISKAISFLDKEHSVYITVKARK